MIYVPWIITVLAVAFAARCYLELWRWAKQCQRATIAIAHKRRVQLRAPLIEWVTWANQLARDEQSTGRVVYRNGHVSVAILRPDVSMSAKTTFRKVREGNRFKAPLRKLRKSSDAPAPKAEEDKTAA